MGNDKLSCLIKHSFLSHKVMIDWMSKILCVQTRSRNVMKEQQASTYSKNRHKHWSKGYGAASSDAKVNGLRSADGELLMAKV